jgi:hypothetical protein
VEEAEGSTPASAFLTVTSGCLPGESDWAFGAALIGKAEDPKDPNFSGAVLVLGDESPFKTVVVETAPLAY